MNGIEMKGTEMDDFQDQQDALEATNYRWRLMYGMNFRENPREFDMDEFMGEMGWDALNP